MRNIHKEVSDRILAAMEQGVMPWTKPWSTIGSGGMPRNAVSSRAYSGANVVLLWLTAEERGYTTSKWLTFKQAQEAGGTVRKGEKGTQVIYASTFDKKDEQTGEMQRIPFLKSFTVFNVAQCDGIDHLQDKPAPVNLDQRNEDCDAFLASTGAVIKHGEARAYYTTAGDFIMLPNYDSFQSADGYYGTALHELVHWSGAESRCNRQFGKRFGDRAYAAEELVAELGAAFMCAEFGYDATTRHAAYVDNWISLLRDDPRAFVTAASKASAAVEYLRSLALAEPEKLAA